MKIYTYDPKKSKNVLAGDYDSVNHIFTKKVNKRHFFIKLKTYAIQEQVIKQLKRIGCINILIISKNKQQISLLQDWLKSPILDFGHGRQYFLKNEKS